MATQQILTSIRNRSRNSYLNSHFDPATRPAVITRRYSDKSSNHEPKPNAKGNSSTNTNPGQLPKFSMNDLGASPTVKAVVYTMIGIMGTVETYAYGKWAWYRWGPTPDGDILEHPQENDPAKP
jgi:hypothetical protein